MQTPRLGRGAAAASQVDGNALTSTAPPAFFQGPDFERAALALAGRGLCVFPLAPGSKIPPKGTHGHKDATRELDLIGRWWAANPSCNIGIATGTRSGIWILDVDPRHGGDQSLARLEAAHGVLPLTVEASTPSGGRHLYFAWPADGVVIRNSTSRIGPGLDVLGEGGGVVAPPSVLAGGGCYRWIRNGATAFAPAPAWLLTLALPPPPPPRAAVTPVDTANLDRYARAALERELARLAAAKDGARNSTLNATAFSLAQLVKAGALPEDATRAALLGQAKAIGQREGEARATIASAFNAAQPRNLRVRP